MSEQAQGRETVISVHQLRKVFKSGKGTVEAVAGIDLEVFAGEVFGFLGPNGAGKTTTLRMLATLMPPTSGVAIVAGRDLRREPDQVRLRIGYVGQLGGADIEITGRSELVFEGRLYGMSTSEARHRAADLLRTLELEDCADRRITTYSGGQRRRLDIGVGLVHRPQLLFLDEPTAGLDPQARAHVWAEVRNLRDSGTTVFLTTHYLEEADALCDRLAIIDHGKIVAEGTPDSLKREVAGDLVTVGMEGDAAAALVLLKSQSFVRDASDEGQLLRLYVDRGETAVPDILRLLDGAGLALTTISVSRPSLDDVFLLQTGHSLRESQQA
ncbi:MAG: ATP-binding cassette domain-containing protein [Candidatus Dormibacteria bacterium]|jgi:ABC-2 type transport system ATP-binding protein